jgi:hypothetical protein
MDAVRQGQEWPKALLPAVAPESEIGDARGFGMP